jgi:hypothetical protein
MATSFDRWEKDPFFLAAEEVQESADRCVALFFLPIPFRGLSLSLSLSLSPLLWVGWPRFALLCSVAIADPVLTSVGSLFASTQDGIGLSGMGAGEERGRFRGGKRHWRPYSCAASPRAAHGAWYRQVAGELVALIVHFEVVLLHVPIAVVPLLNSLVFYSVIGISYRLSDV